MVYGFNNTSAPIETYNNTYTYSPSAYQGYVQFLYCPSVPASPSSSAYMSNYVFNRLAWTSFTLPGNVTKHW